MKNLISLKYKAFLRFILLSFLIINGCQKEDNDLNIFTVNQDIEFGQQLDTQVRENPDQYPVLDRSQYTEAYQHLERIRDEILQSDELIYADRFDWKVTIIHDDEVLNAFAAPGGYMYFYTGLIKFLDEESQFAGVMAHEIAHADRRHSTDMLTKAYGFEILLSIILGEDPGTLAEIASELALGLGRLQFSKKNEYEADEYSVKYLNDTEYHPKGISGFFEKLDTSPTLPEFLSTHPSPENRLEEIDRVWEELGSPDGGTFPERYNEFKNSLP